MSEEEEYPLEEFDQFRLYGEHLALFRESLDRPATISDSARETAIRSSQGIEIDEQERWIIL